MGEFKLSLCLVLAIASVSTGALPIFWHAHENVSIFESVNLGNLGRNIVAGKGYNYAPVAQIEVFNTVGQGVPLWAQQGPDYEVAAAKSADLIAGISYNEVTNHAIGPFSS